MRSYEAARSLFSFLGFISWAVVALGVLAALVGASSVSKYSGGGASLVAMLPGLGIAVAGFLLLAFVQMGRATVDSAEYGQQMLKIARDQLEVSKQRLNAHNQPTGTFASANPDSESRTKRSFSDSKKKPAPKPKQDRIIEYKNISIEVKNGKYWYKGIQFENLSIAEHYVDTYGPKDLQGDVKVKSISSE